MANEREADASQDQLTGWTAWAGDLWQPRNPLLLEIGPGGELFASRVRVVGLWALLSAVHLVPRAFDTRGAHVPAVAVALGAALVIHALVSWTYAAWLPYVSVAFDVLVSAVLVILARPPVGDGAQAAVAWLLLALVMAALRHEPRLVVEAGLLGAPVLVWQAGTQPLPLALWALTAGLLVATLARARRHQALHDTDPLTGLLRRETFEQWLRDELQRSRRHAHRLTLALVEIDHPQELAARHGAARGLAVQRSVATILKRSLRGTDVVARHASGLFAVALPETDARAALPRLDALRCSIALASRGGAEGSAAAAVSVSLGVAGWPDEDRESAGLLALAEQRLRAAREAGGDRLVGPS